MKQEPYRPLSEYERAVIGRLLEADFVGRGEIEDEVSHAEASLIAGTDDNYGSINIRTSSERKAVVVNRVPVMGITKDEAGGHIEILLHVIEGKVDKLEFIRMDGTPMIGLPRLDIMQVHTRSTNEDETTIRVQE
jgi:hypothetical protein